MGERSRRKRTIGVTWHEPSGQYRKYIGKQQGRSGKLTAKVFYLGGSERDAIRRATSLVVEWDALRASGAKCWPSSRKESEATKDTTTDAPAEPTRSVAPSDVTVRDVASLYLEEIHLRANAGQVSWGHYHHSEHRLGRVLEVLGPKTALRAIGAEELTKVVLHFAARPPTKKRPHQKRLVGHPISIKTAKDFVAQTKALFTWAAEHDRLDWVKPKRFERIFKVKWSQMKTSQERERELREVVCGDVQTFSDGDLTKLFQAANSKERLFLLLGLNCGFTSSEISSLARFEVFLDAAEPFIHRKRPKTGVEARWKLWPETIEAIRENLAPRNPHGLAFLSLAGNPLVEVNRRCRRDVIDQTWSRMLKATPLENPLGFRFLRKTGADRIKKLGGLEVSEMYLSHAEPNSMNRHYANRDWAKMHSCLDILRSQLQPLWALKSGSESEAASDSSEQPPESPERREAA